MGRVIKPYTGEKKSPVVFMYLIPELTPLVRGGSPKGRQSQCCRQ